MLARRIDSTLVGIEARARAGHPGYARLVANGVPTQLRRERAWVAEQASALGRALRSADRRRPYRLSQAGASVLRAELATWQNLAATGLRRLEVPA